MEELLGSCELLGSSSEFLDAGITSSEMAESSGSSSGSCEPTPEEREARKNRKNRKGPQDPNKPSQSASLDQDLRDIPFR